MSDATNEQYRRANGIMLECLQAIAHGEVEPNVRGAEAVAAQQAIGMAFHAMGWPPPAPHRNLGEPT